MTLELWQDTDKRRALLLSVLVHLLALLLLFWVWTRPQPVPLDSFLVIDVGTPALSDAVTDAPTADAPAPQAAEPLVAAPEAGEPAAAAPPAPAPLETEPAIADIDAEPATPEALEPEQAQAETEPDPEPIAQEAPPEPVAELPTEPGEAEPEAAEVEVAVPAEPVLEAAAPPLPTARTPEAASSEVELPPAEVTTTTLPEIDEAELEPQPLAQALPIPQPTPDLAVTPARSVSVMPTAQVAPEQAIPRPQVNAASAPPQTVPQPQVSASVAQAQTLPQPQVEATVAQARAVPQPRVAASVAQAQSVPTPQATASVTPAQAVPKPQASVSVASSHPVPRPAASATVSAAQAVPQPQVQTSVAAAQTVPRPSVSAAVSAEGTGATTTDTDSQAVVDTLEDALADSTSPAGQTATPTPGGNSDRSGQTTAQEGADEANLGLAAGPDGSGDPTGAPLARVPYRENRDRPLAVMIDNANGYPQAGLLEASLIVEMPVEGGLTRLMTVYDRIDPAQVGPVRSARDYFHTISEEMNGILVHDGGSPAALAAISRSELPSINAYTSGDLFAREGERSAPYNLYTRGTALRQAVNRLDLNRSRVVSGTVYRPEATEVAVERVEVEFSGDYASAFRFVNDLNLYRWVRDGEDAVDAFGEAVYVDAVLVATVEARPIADDPEGRLYIPIRGGKATLYLRGRAIPGRWDPADGVRFVTSVGDVVNLEPFKVWVAFTPSYAAVVER